MASFEGNWYKQKKGVPTGGSLCVQLANITVYSIMRKAVYNDETIMNNIMSAKRYVDDGAGLFNGSREAFNSWIVPVNKKLCPFGLTIDESCIFFLSKTSQLVQDTNTIAIKYINRIRDRNM